MVQRLILNVKYRNILIIFSTFRDFLLLSALINCF